MKAPSECNGRRMIAACLWAAVLGAAAAACGNRQHVVQGVRYSNDRQTLEMASIMPTCSCVSLANMRTPTASTGPAGDATATSRPPDPHDIAIVSRHAGSVIGVERLSPGLPLQVQTDWAGENAGDVYQVAAYEVGRGGTGFDENKPLIPISSYVYYDKVLPTLCNDNMQCRFGNLNLNQQLHAPVAQGEVQTVQRGVQLTKAGEQLQLRASAGRDEQHCGCVAVQARASPVVLKATLLARTLGHMTLSPGEVRFIAFDDGGPYPDNRYVLTALMPPTATRAQNEGISQGGYTEKTLKISDVLDIVGEMDHMRCNYLASFLETGVTPLLAPPEGADIEAPVPASPGAADVPDPVTPRAAGRQTPPTRTVPGIAPPATVEELKRLVVPPFVPCPFDPLSMNQNTPRISR